MSGQVSTVENQSIIDSTNESRVIVIENIQNATISDPVAAFLEKHGNKLTLDHQGKPVTYSEAVRGCPALGDLIKVMGDGALGLTAANHENEQIEEHETENLAKQTAEIVVSEQPENITSTEFTEPKEDYKLKVDLNKEARVIKETESKVVPTKDSSFQPQDQVETPPESGKNDAGKNAEVAVQSFANDKKAVEKFESLDYENTHQPDSSSIAQEVVMAETYAEAEFVDKVEEAKAIPKAEPASGGTELDMVTTDEYKEEVEISNIAEDVAKAVNIDHPAPRPFEFVKPIQEVALEDLPVSFDIGLEDNLRADKITETAEGPTLEAEDVSELTFQIPEVHQPEKLVLTEGPESNLAQEAEAVEELMIGVDERMQELAEEGTPEAEQLLAEVNEIMDEIQFTIESHQTLLTEPKDETDLALMAEIDVVEGEKEKLKELFLQLFDKLEIEYSPDLVDACVRIALAGEIYEFKKSREEDELPTPQDSGTHEILRQIITAASDLKRALQQACHVGRLACCYLWPQALQLNIRVISKG